VGVYYDNVIGTYVIGNCVLQAWGRWFSGERIMEKTGQNMTGMVRTGGGHVFYEKSFINIRPPSFI
jgi:hypothetical protein